MAYYKDIDVIEAIYDALRTPPLKGDLTDTMSLAVAMAQRLPGVDIHEISKRECTTLLRGGVMLTEQLIETFGTKRFGFIREKLERDLGKALFRMLTIEEERHPDIQARLYRATIRVWHEGEEEDAEND